MLLLLLAPALLLVLRAEEPAVDRTHPPAAGPEPAVAFPDTRERTLPNGLKIFVVESRRQPTVTFRLLLKRGAIADGDKPGVASATADLLNEGTATRDADRFAEEADGLGAEVEASAGNDSLSVTASGLTKFLPQVLDLFADAALRPTFPEERLKKHQRRSLSRLAQERQQPGSLAGKLRGKLLYGDKHPYGAYETEASVKALRREDLVAFHQVNFLPNHATLAVVGDVNTDAVVAQIAKAFGDWKPGDLPALELPALPPGPTKLTVHLVDRPASVQSAVLVCAPGVRRADPDVPELGVVNGVLGGGENGRLFLNLRERRGYTYGSGSSFGSAREAGLFSASAEVRNDVTEPAVREMLAEIGRIRDEPIPEPELARQRSSMAGNYLLSLESPATVASRVQEMELYGLPGDYYRTYARRIGGVTVERAQALAKAHVPAPDRVTVVVVGEAKDIRPALEKLGPVVGYDQDLRATGK